MKSLTAQSNTARALFGVLLGAAVLLSSTGTARACAVCMGSDNPQLAEASNTVLWSLLSLVGFIFVATGCTAWYLVRRARLSSSIQLRDCLVPPSDKNV